MTGTKILPDTHIALWAITDDEKLSNAAGELLLSYSNEIFYSTASVRELSVKHSIHPEHMTFSGREFSDNCRLAGYSNLPVKDLHIFTPETLSRPDVAPRHTIP